MQNRVVISGDTGAELFSLGISIPTAVHSQSQYNFVPLGIATSDDHDVVAEVLKPVIGQLNDLIDHQSDSITSVFYPPEFCMKIGDDSCAVPEFLVGGDWLWINNCMGLKGPSADHPCFSCLVPKEELLQAAPQRMLQFHCETLSQKEDQQPFFFKIIW